jgi:hypothetical protein
MESAAIDKAMAQIADGVHHAANSSSNGSSGFGKDEQPFRP